MNESIKLDALMAVVSAYLKRGCDLQYDQRSMDRILQLTPRRRKRLPPEAATPDHTLFLDCSGYVSAIFYETFGYELPSDLTWHMIDLVEPQVYYYEITHQETAEERGAIEAELRELLQPGDIITYDRYVGSGHTMLYLGNDRYTDCTAGGRPDGYDYAGRKNRYYPEGGLFVQPLEKLFACENGGLAPSNLFHEKKRRFAVSRPLERMGEPTPRSLARLGDARDLVCAVTTSHPGAKMADAGDTVIYTLRVRSFREENCTVNISLEAGLTGDGTVQCMLPAHGGTEVRFALQVKDTQAMWIRPRVTVNTLDVWTPRVLLGKLPTQARLSRLCADFDRELAVCGDALQAAARAYAAQGIPMAERGRDFVFSHFYLHDSPAGDVLSRRPQDPQRDLSVWGMFGGTGVITAEMATSDGMRCTQLERRDLMPGDVILCCDDACGHGCYGSFYDGDCLTGAFEDGECVRSIRDEELDAFVDSLFGRYAFILLRPFQAQ